MEEIKILCTPDDWDNSTLIARNVKRSNRTIEERYTTIVASKLPEPLLAVWHVAVETIRSQGKGEWNAATVIVRKKPANYCQQENPVQIIALITARYPDLTVEQQEPVTFEQEEIITFFDTLTNETFWTEQEQSPTEDHE